MSTQTRIPVFASEPPGDQAVPAPTNSQTVPLLDACQLLGTNREVRLAHNHQEYRLRITRNNKLILTK